MRERRVGGVQLFVLAALAMTVVMSYVTGSPRLLLIRGGWGMAALGVWMLGSLLFRRPFLYEATRVVLDEDKQRSWQRSWQEHPAFRRLLGLLSAFWGAACVADALLRVVLAMTLPVDVVPVLDAVLLVVTVAVVLIVQRFFGRAYLRRSGLRRQGVVVTPLPAPAPAPA